MKGRIEMNQINQSMNNSNLKEAMDALCWCLEEVKSWIQADKLKQNSDKAEALLVGSNLVLGSNSMSTLVGL